jgi:hypothetical protein
MINPDEDMIANVVDPLILEIYLYKNNYKDRILISELKEKAHTVRIPEMEGTCFFVRVEDVISILNTSFKKDIKNFGSISEKSLSNNVTSIYFIDNMIKSFESIKYFKVNVSNSEVYTRLNKDTITFDYKIIHSRINFPSFCTPEFLEKCKEIFQKIGVYKRDIFDKAPYFEIMSNDLIDKLVIYSQGLTDGEEMIYVENILMLLGSKVEKDNPILLVIVEN